MSTISLRPYQLEAVDTVERCDVQRPLVELPTGTGKTIIFAELIRRRQRRALVLAHRDGLIEQAVDKIKLVHPTADIGVVKAERDEHAAPVVVASVQTLGRPRRLDRIDPDFGTVVVDEAHHATAEAYVCILDRLGCMGAGGPLTLGVTATAERADGTPLGEVWQKIVYRRTLLEMIEAGYLSDLRAVRVRVQVDLDAVPQHHGDFTVGALDHAMHDAGAPAHALDAYQVHAANRKALVFTPGVDLAHEVAAVFREAGIVAEALDGTTPIDERRAILRRLRTGETRVVANCAVLTEGFDEPSIDCIICARPTKSRTLYRQMIGRGTRLYPAKTDCLVLDLVGNTRHGLVTLAGLFDLLPEALEADDDRTAAPTVTQAIQRIAERGRLVAETVDIFQRAELSWVPGGEMMHALSIGERGMLVLRTDDLETWRVVLVDRDHHRTLIADGLDLGYAQGVAEDYARCAGAGQLVQRGARWRHQPASEKQVAALVRMRIPHDPARLTKGEAADLMTAVIARRIA